MQGLSRKLYIVILLLVFGIFFFTLTKKNPAHRTTSIPTPSPSSSASASPTVRPSIADHHCVDENEISSITGKDYALVRETQLVETDTIECQYEVSDQIRGVNPSVHYVYKIVTDQKNWEASHDEISKKPSNRRIEGKDYLIADVNPVFEIAQATFYGHTADKVYVELTYTPVDSEVGVVLDKGVQLIDKVLEKG